MGEDLTSSRIDRRNILNDELALQAIREASKIEGIVFEGKPRFTQSMVASFFGVESGTIERCVNDAADELVNNGYEILRGRRLEAFLHSLREQDAADVNVESASQLAIFDFRSFLNLAMLLAESEKARVLRLLILDIVVDSINIKTGGGAKYVEVFEKVFSQEEDYASLQFLEGCNQPQEAIQLLESEESPRLFGIERLMSKNEDVLRRLKARK